jgi:hypothetical protein
MDVCEIKADFSLIVITSEFLIIYPPKALFVSIRKNNRCFDNNKRVCILLIMLFLSIIAQIY